MMKENSVASRRNFLRKTIKASIASSLLPLNKVWPPIRDKPQRVVIIMIDGFGLSYLKQSDMPTLRKWMQTGFYKPVKAVMPTVTNANNASICCGVFPDVHGITGNSYYDVDTGKEEYMESADLLLAPTIFERAKHFNVWSALLTSKRKTAGLLGRGAETIIIAEAPTDEMVRKYGPAPDIYSREINYWLFKAGIDLLKTRPDLGCLYVHTTDYPMHHWAPESSESKEHLARLDALLAEATAAAPDAAFFLTADQT